MRTPSTYWTCCRDKWRKGRNVKRVNNRIPRKRPKGYGTFIGSVRVEWAFSHPRNMRLLQSVEYFDPNGKKWTAPMGSVIDGAYVGWYRRATVLHNVYCDRRGRYDVYCCGERGPSSVEVHWMFYQAMRCDGTHPITAWVMWFAARILGSKFKGQSIC